MLVQMVQRSSVTPGHTTKRFGTRFSVRTVKEQVHYDPSPPSGLTLDAEYCQIPPLLSPKIYDTFIAECILCKKPAGSFTAIDQPCTYIYGS